MATSQQAGDLSLSRGFEQSPHNRHKKTRAIAKAIDRAYAPQEQRDAKGVTCYLNTSSPLKT
jgi:hypothetical protein